LARIGLLRLFVSLFAEGQIIFDGIREGALVALLLRMRPVENGPHAVQSDPDSRALPFAGLATAGH
jgi:hypothetical protein